MSQNCQTPQFIKVANQCYFCHNTLHITHVFLSTKAHINLFNILHHNSTAVNNNNNNIIITAIV